MSRQILAGTLALLAAAVGAQTSAPLSAHEQPKEGATALSVALPELVLRGTAPVMFATLVREAGLSGGAATLNRACSQSPDSSISVGAGTTLRSALEQLAKSESASEWQLRDGVPNLLPQGQVPPLLLVRIRRFEWDKTTALTEIISRLRQLPEVSETALRLGLTEAPFEGGANASCIRGDCSPKSKLATAPEIEEDITLLTLLNRVVRAHDRAIWSYSEYRCDKGTQFRLGILAE